MARKATQTPVIDGPAYDPEKVVELEHETSQQSDRQLAVMERYGDGLPYDRQRMIDKARFHLTHAAESMLEAGKCILVIKECEPHGDFISTVTEQLGLDYHVAHRMAQAAAKFLSPKLQSKVETFQLLGKSKLYELAFLDDDDLAELAEGGSVAGMELDDIESMSVRELKKALREARQDREAQSRRMADVNDEPRAAKEEARLIKNLPPDEIAARMRREISEISDAACVQIQGSLRRACETYVDHVFEHGIAERDWQPYLITLLDHLENAVATVRGVTGIQAGTPLPGDGLDWLDEASQILEASRAAESDQHNQH